MAEGFANALTGEGIKAQSAGIAASRGQAAAEAVEVMGRIYGIDISKHESRHIDDYKLEEFDYVIAMDGMVYHRLKESRHYPDHSLFEWDIEDPIGLPAWAFARAAEKIRGRLEAFIINRDAS